MLKYFKSLIIDDNFFIVYVLIYGLDLLVVLLCMS